MAEKTKHVLVPLAKGFEETEAVAIVDVLRRAGLRVTLAALEPGAVEGGHGIVVQPDRTLDQVDPEGVDAIVLPGGAGGTQRLLDDERVLGLVRALHGKGRPTAAICAAPTVLAAAGIAAGVEMTSHPSVREELGEARVSDEPVVLSGPVWTSQGVGTAVEFGLAIVGELCGAEVSRGLAEAMVVQARTAGARGEPVRPR